MNVIDTALPDVKVIEPDVFKDKRGFFTETFNQERFNEKLGKEIIFVQDNHSRSQKNILRGLHYQIQNTQGKLVRVTLGSVIDVAVDMRQDSPNFGQHVAVELSHDNFRQLWVPEGFAHGFYVTSDVAEFQYKCTDYYNPQAEVSVLWNDPDLNIDWSLLLSSEPILSEKDLNGVLFKDAFYF